MPDEHAPDPEFCDPVAVERVLRGREPVGRKLTRAERICALRWMDEFRVPFSTLAYRLGLNNAALRRLREEAAVCLDHEHSDRPQSSAPRVDHRTDRKENHG